MEQILISTIPGLAFACAVFLSILGMIQFRIFIKKGYRRSRSLSLFCFCAAIFAFEHFIAQSRAFSPEFTRGYVIVSTMAICLSLVFYMQSLSYFIAIPNRIFKIYTWSAMALVAVVGIGIAMVPFVDHVLFFDPQEMLETSNFFVNSYTLRIGQPGMFINTSLSVSSVITVVGALFLLRNVWRSTRDYYFITGLGISIFAAVVENFLLPFTYAYFFPVVFMSNLFEAFRMNSLSYREYTREKKRLEKQKDPDETPAADKYQNSNLTEQRIAELAEKLRLVLDQEKLYLNPNLNSEDLARKIGIPTYQLSQVVNIGLNTTFFEMLSQHRIEEVKRRLKDQSFDDETIINIAYSSGFNSKSAFNTAFKKQTGVTPSVYRKGQ